MDILSYILIGIAAIAGGAVNALAGGGTLITFPVLMAVGVPAVPANITNTVALCPGYLGGTFAQLRDLRGHERHLWFLAPAGVLGGIAGGLLLLNTGESMFRALVPYLIFLAAGLLAVQERLRAWLVGRTGGEEQAGLHEAWTVLPVFLAAIYGGYFGAGLSVIVLAVLGLVLEDTLTRLNALKQIISFSINIAAAIFFLFSGKIVWSAALVMMVGALTGGALGGKLAGRIKPAALRRIVVTVGVIIGIFYLVR
ncbi:MAG: sulfite exporter TauE/SafE family protein [Deltaproteobacteria bacterium]|nr:sulfite exporter TauE/SafE family protein [Deltaproteobacteria bacterium]